MRDRLLSIVTLSLEEYNASAETPIDTSGVEDLFLYGDRGVFDSMQLVNFLTLLEEKIFDDLKVAVSLTSERAVSRRVSPFRSVAYLIDFICEEMEAPMPEAAALG